MESGSTGTRSASINIVETNSSEADNEKVPLLSPSPSIVIDSSTLTSQLLSHHWLDKLNSAIKRGKAYRIRKFSSKGAVLVLILNFLISAGYGVPAGNGNSYHFYEDPHQDHKASEYPDEPNWLIRDLIPILPWSLSITILGLLADIRYGRKRMVWCGILLLWVVTIVDCVRSSLYYSLNFSHKEPLLHTVFTIDAVLSYIATAAFLVNSVQLAIDQLVDASAEQVSSFIQWYIFTYFFGAWIFNQATSPKGPLYYCFHVTNKGNFKILSSLTQVVFVSLALFFVAFCGHWIKPTTFPRNNPLKLVWQVLKFASKHKYPVYRSALTYWEDDIPSRINLGKDKYGGPFTNEQVEDVKTFLRMISLALPCAAPAIASFLAANDFVFSMSQNSTSSVTDFKFTFLADYSECTRSLYAAYLSNIHLWGCIYVLCSEFIIYPLCNRYIPRMLKRIGWMFILIIPEGLALLVLNIVALVDRTHPLTIDRLAICSIVTAISTMQFYLVVSTFLEFICAQSPQNMKGFLIGFMWLTVVLFVVIAYFIYYVFSLKCRMSGCGTAYFSLVTILSVVGFVAYCVVAKWYKHRERDDCPNDQAIIEEVYTRHLANRTVTTSSVS